MYFRSAVVILLAFILAGAPAVVTGIEKSSEGNRTAQIELKLGDGKTKSISVTLKQSAIDVYNLCKPAKVYADDDPWLIAMGAGGGTYVFFFAAEGTPEQLRERLDPRRDQLHAVLRFPTHARENGTFLLPDTASDETYGDFVTLKVLLEPSKAKAATVASGMSTEKVKHLFPNAADHANDDHAVVFDSVHNDSRYLLIFTPEEDGKTHDPKCDKLSEIIYRIDDKAEAIYLLPRSQRGNPVVAEYGRLLGMSESKSVSGNNQ